MPKILPALGTVLIIAASIGFNTMRYPIVWEMTGPSTEPAENSEAAEAESAASSTPAALAVESAATSPSHAEDKARPPEPPETPVAKTGGDLPVEKPATAAIAANETKSSVEAQANPLESAQIVKAEPARREETPPMTKLVPITIGLISGNAGQTAAARPGEDAARPADDAGVRRLPPVEPSQPLPAGRYAAEYRAAPLVIYPSTGR
jgi:hypothetical protein